MTIPGDIAAEPAPERRSSLAVWRNHDPAAVRQMWLHGAIAYVLSRLFVLAGASAVAVFRAKADPEQAVKEATVTKDAINVLTSWDGAWYMRIVRDGYPRHIPPDVTYFVNEARAAFFPLYPRLVRAVDPLLPAGDVAAALVVAWLAGIVAIALVGLMALQVFTPRVAARAMTLTAFFPGSFVLSFTYSESMLLMLAAACLFLLHERRWVLAGLAAGIGTAARPNALALCVACTVAAVIAIRERRTWIALAAPILSPLGYVGFQLFLAQHTGEREAWFRVQREAWDEGVSFGLTALRGIGNAVIHPLSSPGNTITLFTMAILAGLVWTSTRVKLPAVWWAYSLAVVALILLPSTVAPRPRFVLTAFPLLIGTAAWWPNHDRDGWAYTLAIGGASLVALTAVYGGFGAIP
jgi:hypothetical protein